MPGKVYILTLVISLIITQDWDYSADMAEIKTINNEKIKQFEGNVFINRDNLKLNTNKAIEYVDRAELHLYGDITMIDDKDTIH